MPSYRLPAAAMMVVSLSAPTFAGVFSPPTPEHQWAVIGSPGNAPNVYTETPGNTPRSRGSVAYEYAITKTEITALQWNEFVQAYTPYIAQANRFDSRFFSDRFRPVFLPNNQVRYEMLPAASQYPVEIGWRYAARYCNWLHNGKVNEAWAFENGAYDTSTFGDLPGGYFTDQISHNPDAKFWIPTIDEWYKAAYFDPHKNGQNQPGYWLYPTTSDTAPISGLPQNGGETSAGVPRTGPDFDYPPTAAYADVMSPWGLWDLSGGYREWLEDAPFQPGRPPASRLQRGSGAGDPSWEYRDRYDAISYSGSPRTSYGGFRIVSAIPAPSTGTLVIFAGLIFNPFPRRYRR